MEVFILEVGCMTRMIQARCQVSFRN